jgi:hypothetical protein
VSDVKVNKQEIIINIKKNTSSNISIQKEDLQVTIIKK